VDWSRAPSYLTGGGDIGHIDAVLKALADHGATGLSYRDLYRVIPPGELAREIRLGSGAVQ
jgi:transposase